MKTWLGLGILACVFCCGINQAAAAPLTTYVSEFKVSGADSNADLPVMLQRMLASRLSPDHVQLVDSKKRAELVITGSYTAFGKMFSLDLALQNSANGNLSTLFEQGSGQDDIIPAMGRVAQKADKVISGLPPKQSAMFAAPTPTPPAPLPSAQQMPVTASAQQQSGGYVVRTAEREVHNDSSSWESAPLNGIFNSLAIGQTRASGEKEIFIAGDNTVGFYLKGSTLVKQSEVAIALPAKILSLDAADLDHDGTTELYVTSIDRNTLVSRIYTVEGSSLKLVASKLPWFFRGIGLSVKSRSMYVQKMGLKGEYHDGVAELTKSGSRFETGKQLLLPRFGTLYTFNRMNDTKGNQLYIVLDHDGYLLVYSQAGEEIWKSADKFGGSETYFVHSNFSNFRSSREKEHTSFLEQRITILPDGMVLVPTNTGGFSIGNNRSYGKHSFTAFQWTGSMLKEKWHTQQAPSYLADYAYDADERALLLLEVTQKAGLQKSGKTIISVKKMD